MRVKRFIGELLRGSGDRLPGEGEHGAFARHRGLIVLSAGGATAETALLWLVAPGARALGPQVTALPPLAAYHDLRWLFLFSGSWPAFGAVLVGALIARSAIDAALVMLAWPHTELDAAIRPRFVTAFWSCALLTLLVWMVLSPVVTLMFGAALVPFSWPFLGAAPILLGSVLALSHGGIGSAWWGRLPAVSTIAWLLTGFIAMSVVGAVMPRVNAAEYLGVAALAGLLSARAWYGVTLSAVRQARAEPPAWYWRAALWQVKRALRQRISWLPVAPVAAVLVVGLVVTMARLAFTGTVHLTPPAGHVAEGVVPGVGTAPAVQAEPVTGQPAHGSLLVVAGWGSHCCNDANALRAAEPGMTVRQFSYLGLTAAGQPIRYHLAADLPIQVLGDRMAAQVEWLYAHTHTPVSIVAESEGTLGLYAMAARHPGLPIASVVLLSPIVEPGQVGRAGVPGEALITLNDLIGKMSPYGGSGAEELIDSVSQFGASYFADMTRKHVFRWLTVIPLADAVTLPSCPYPSNVVVVQALHGGLLGDPPVLQMVEEFLAGDTNVRSDQRLRTAAQVIAAAAAAWRIPDLHPACPGG
ncbi:MAG: hypothetical protein JO345_38990 [Streptosporangiaceae bacterium]|nr:hypothetical protein [Streptosporangiaceae bacterium]